MSEVVPNLLLEKYDESHFVTKHIHVQTHIPNIHKHTQDIYYNIYTC